jgi:uncharacterized secreted protein with C-terminal beta-propeller domain
MKKMMMTAVIVTVMMVAGTFISGSAQPEQTKVPVSITTPDKIESRIGTLQYTVDTRYY